jgi:DNA-binding IclR family transcriptional regulator
VARDQAETGCDHVLTKEAGNSNVRAVERALQILGCFDDKHAERGVSEIAQAVGLHKATAHRIVTTLMAYGYLERAEDGQRYRLGTRLANLGFMVIRRTDLRREAMPIMTELAARLDETCDLSVYNRGEVYFIEVVQGSRALTVAAAVGRSLPIHATASGKVILAFVPEAESEAALDEPLVAHTHRTIIRPAESSTASTHSSVERSTRHGVSGHAASRWMPPGSVTTTAPMRAPGRARARFQMLVRGPTETSSSRLAVGSTRAEGSIT